MKTKWLEAGINLLFWGCTGWFIVSTFSVESQEIIMETNGYESIKTVRNFDRANLLLLNVLIACLLFYTNLYLITRLKKRENFFYPLLFSGAAFLVALLLITSLPRVFFFGIQTIISIPLVFGILLFYYAVSVGYGIGKLWWIAEAQRQRLTLEKKQAELNLLRLQLHPHFLFNVLNNLLAMVDQKRNPKMAETIDRLSGMLRYVVYETERDSVSLEKEINFIRDYAELQLMRYEQEEVDFKLTVEGEDRAILVEPGIFISFVENAFKHGVQAEEQSFVQVCFDLTIAGKIIFTVRNSIHPNYPSLEKGGTGLAATRKRLQIVYPDQHQLTIKEDQCYTLKLELQPHENHHS
ncbi:MAG: sensor histidine kinase [Saprospiraceae bacterium]|nr:MAG: sensor histidine kinase [Saprospiraceae bacterium]